MAVMAKPLTDDDIANLAAWFCLDPHRGAGRPERAPSSRRSPRGRLLSRPAWRRPRRFDAQRRAGRHHRQRRRAARSSTRPTPSASSMRTNCAPPARWSTCPKPSRACPGWWSTTATTTRRTCRSTRAASAPAPPSACAASGCTPTASRPAARRPGPGLALRHRRGPAHRGPARPVLGAVRQQLGRRDLADQRRAHRAPLALDGDIGSDGLRQWRARRRGAARRAASTCARRSAVSRPTASARRAPPSARWATCDWAGTASRDRVVVVLNSIDQPALDPLGLTRAQFEADPDQTAGIALPQDEPGQALPLQHAQEHAPGPGRRELAPPLRATPARCARACSRPTSASAR